MTALCAFGLSVAFAVPVPDGVDVVLRNRLTRQTPDVTACTLDVDGLRIGIVWHHTPNAPDVIEITPPPGWTVDKSPATVPENDETAAKVRPMEMM
jgi:hypothetical protein